MIRYFRKYMFICIGILIMVVIGYVVLDNQLNETVSVSYDSKIVDLKPLHYRNEPFKVFFESYYDIPLIENDINLLIDLHDVVVDEIEVLEYILDDQGHLRYTEKEIRTVPIRIINEDYFLTLDEHPAIFLSSSIDEFVYHGIEMVITGNGKTQSHLFVFKTLGKKNIQDTVEENQGEEVDYAKIFELTLQDLVETNTNPTDKMTYIAVDYHEIVQFEDMEKSDIESYLISYRVPIIEETYETLKEKNLLVDDVYFNGMFLKINSIEFTTSEAVIVNASKYTASQGYVDITLTLKKIEDVWTITYSEMTLSD